MAGLEIVTLNICLKQQGYSLFPKQSYFLFEATVYRFASELFSTLI